MDFTKLTATLEKLGYQVSLFPTAAQAADYLNEQIDGCSVGIGGSVTLRDMGMYGKSCAETWGLLLWRTPQSDCL